MSTNVNIVSVDILDNPAPFSANYNLKITFEAFTELPHDLEFELVYVGSGGSEEFDQALDSVFIGPTPEGRHEFVFEAAAPNPSKIPTDDVVGVTVLLLKVKYNGNEFINLGWYVAVEYTDPELIESPPTQPNIEKLTRTVKVESLRVTTHAIKWVADQADEYPPEEVIDETDVIDMGVGDADMEEDEQREEEECDEAEENEEEEDLDALADADEKEKDEEEEKGESAQKMEGEDEQMDEGGDSGKNESTENVSSSPAPTDKTTVSTPIDSEQALSDVTNA